ncbi:glycosyltransferase [Rheinheimera maricola]|uniref:Glycosyltransferase n=1 Tax=Rheinheimera maricola TaxID=2793282 RepID=A0ABS7X486_9GAMM|nr:glycosyltransferase [Rheinheimera maricola]MBZ9610358.1 glycosyltransferase [Rheinheimera maricola]
MQISVIVPCFNAVGKIERCLSALAAIEFNAGQFEVIFVDDCSTDNTLSLLQQQTANRQNWRVLQLPQNSGSPSAPRNLGLSQARGDYVFFLDSDDEIFPDTLNTHYQHALQTNACIVRGYLIADTGREQLEMNKVHNWQANLTRQQRIAAIIAHQSTIPCSLIKRSLLQQHTITWPEALRMGEDSYFLAQVLSVAEQVEYLSHPTYIYNQRRSFVASSTQSYGARELRNHLIVWQGVQQALALAGVDYFALRLQKGLQAVLASLVFRNRYDIDEALFLQFADFIRQNWPLIATFNYIPRNRELLQTLLNSDFAGFSALCKPRLLIAGYDLKFIQPVLTALGHYFTVITDEWRGHNSHDESHSLQQLAQADYIWCEWLLGNAVWYSKHKTPQQKLVCRMHRFELSREFGEQLNLSGVDAITAVSVLFFERLMERFPAIPRQKVRLLPNFVDVAGYDQVSFADSRFTLAMIGYVPAKKGLLHALQILAELRQKDSRYRLKLFGKAPAELPWLKNHPDELAYFADCEQHIRDLGLTDAVEHVGFADIKKAMAQHQVGFVLSVSESMRELPGFESFHLAVADAYAAGAVGLVKQWTGCEYVYPPQMITPDTNALVSKIWQLTQDKAAYQQLQQTGISFIERHYNVSAFVQHVRALYDEI